MGWLDVINVGLNVAQVAQVSKVNQQLGSMQDQQMLSAIQAEVLKEIRNLIFEFNKKAKKLIELKDRYPQQANALAYSLMYKFDQLGISARNLPEYSDKEKFEETKDLLEKSIIESEEGLSTSEKTQVKDCVEAINKLETLNEAIYYAEKKRELESTNPEWEALTRKRSNNQIIGFSGLGGGFLISMVLCGNGGNTTVGTILFFMGVGLVIGLIFIKKKVEGYEALKAKREELKKISPSNEQISVFHEVLGKISLEQMLAEKRRLEAIVSGVFNVEMDYEAKKLFAV